MPIAGMETVVDGLVVRFWKPVLVPVFNVLYSFSLSLMVSGVKWVWDANPDANIEIEKEGQD